MIFKRTHLAALAGVSLLPATVVANEDDEHHQIEEVVVSALPLGRTVEALAQPATVLAGDALTRAVSTSIGETIADQPGVSATYFGPIASRPVIRGQFGERVLVLSNGLDALDASALSEDHATTVDSLIAKRVEIVRGPATLIYGSGAAGGLVNVVDSRIHEAPLEDTLSGSLAFNVDSALGAEKGAGALDFGTDRFAGHIDFMTRETDDVEIPGFAESEILRTLEGELDGEPELTLENSASETDSFALGFSVFGEGSDFLGISFTDYETNYGIPGGHEHEEEEGGAEEEEEIISIDMEQQRFDVRGQKELDWVFESVRLKFASNDYKHIEFEGEEVGTTYETTGSDLFIDLLQKSTDRLSGTVGLHHKRVELEAVGEEAFVPSSETDQLALYAFQEWQLSDRLAVQGSARIERQTISVDVLDDYSGTAIGASFGAIYNLADNLDLSANLAITERNPNATELYADGPHLAVSRYERGSVALGNGELDKELSTNIDVTLRGENGPLRWSVTAFNNDISDYIVLSPTGLELDELPVFDFRQTDASLYGLEGEVLTDIVETNTQHLHVRVFGDFVHGEEDNGNYLPRITPTRYGAGLHYTTGGFDAELTATRHSEHTRVASNELPTAAFTMVDAEVSYRASDVLFFLKGTNLGDEDARRHTSPLKDLAPLPGRSIHFGVRYDFTM